MAISLSFRSLLTFLEGEGWWAAPAKRHLLDQAIRLGGEAPEGQNTPEGEDDPGGFPPPPIPDSSNLRPLSSWSAAGFEPSTLTVSGPASPEDTDKGGERKAAPRTLHLAPTQQHPRQVQAVGWMASAGRPIDRLTRALEPSLSTEDAHHESDLDHLHDHADGVCGELPQEQAPGTAEGAIAGGVGIAGGAPLVAYADTFRLSSNPTARTTIYLDFDGHTTTGTAWNNSTMGASFVSPAYNTDGNAAFSNTELTLIQQAWQRVASDFAPFDVNVTTQAPPDDWLIKSSANDPNYGIRVVMTSYGPSSSTAGGIAYIDSFNWNSDTPCFVYNTSLIGVSEAVSHEVGHTLGLSHDGTLSGDAYYAGHGSGETGWASIMGVGYYKNVSTWDNGTFYNSNNGGGGANYNRGPDDLAIITGLNGFGYQADQEGNSQATANALSIQGASISQYGTIETRSDLDWFSFTLGSLGSLNLTFDPYWYRTFIDTDGIWGGAVNPYYAKVSDANPGTTWADNAANLDLSIELYNSSNVLVASANPTGLAASLTLNNLAADTYFLKLDGVGFGSPALNPPTGYSDYGSLGSYLISGTITGATAQPQISLAIGPNFSVKEDSSPLLIYTFTRTGDTSSALTFNVNLGGTATLGSDYAISGWSTGTVTIAAGQATATVSVDPNSDTAQENDESVTLQISNGNGYGVATTAAVIGTITNDDVPSVSLTVSPASVSEDGATNLIYTFSRSYASAEALVVSYTIGGTATLGSDYTGPSTSGVVKTITIAANSTSASLVVDPTTDTLFEANESVALSLFAGFGYSIGTAAPVVGTITNDDLPVVSLTLAPPSVAENGISPLVYTFTRDGLNSSALTVSYAIGGTATNGLDYGSLGTSVTFAAGSSTATVSILPINETLVEADETVALSLVAAGSYRVGTIGAITGTITNDDLPVITLALNPVSAPEAGNDTLLFTFTRSGPTTAPLSVSYAISGTATNGVDYTSIGSTITFAAGSSTATVAIDPLSDALVENDEIVVLTLQPGPGYGVGTPTAVGGTILNSDPPVITLTVSPAQVRESGVDGGLLYTFSRSGATADALTVGFAVGGTASQGIDYAALGTSVRFEAGAATAALLVSPLADTLSEGDETVEISLTAGNGYTVGTSSPVVGILTNVELPLISLTVEAERVSEDGGAPLRFTFHRDLVSLEPLTVAYSLGGTATAGSDFALLSGTLAFAAGASEAVLEVSPTADTVMEPDETVELSLVAGPAYRVASTTAVVGTFLNDDLPLVSLTLDPAVVEEDGGGALVYRLARNGPTTASLVVALAVGGTATNGEDYTTIGTSVTFAPGQSLTTLTVAPLADGAIEPDESVALSLVPDATYAVASTAPVEGTIRNDDWPVITLEPSAAAVVENSGLPLTWILRRSGPLERGLMVAISATGTATSGQDYASIGPSIGFAPGESAFTLAITPTGDALIEADETIDLSLVAGDDYMIGTPGVVSGTILNDDLPVISLAVTPAAVNENGGSALVYSFFRTGPTNSALTVTYRVDGSASLGIDYDGIASAGTSKSITFAAGAGTVTLSVSPIGDSTVETSESVAITLLQDGGYTIGTSGPVVGTILNDDLPSVTLAVSPAAVAEGGSTNLVFTFSRSVATADPLTVSYSVGGSATLGVDYSGINGGPGNRTLTLAPGALSAQVIVDPIDDRAIESDETVVLSLAAGSGYTVGTTTPVSGVINNDDANPSLVFTPGQDTLTGVAGADVFQWIDLKHSLLVSAASLDKVINLVTTEDVFDSPFRTTAVIPKGAGSVSALSELGIATRLNTNRFVANGAATFTLGGGSNKRTFLGINDGIAGYQATNDAIIEVTGYSGSLGSLQVL